MKLSYPIILASASPRRRQFLKTLNLPFTVHTADIDETPYPQESPSTLACRLSRQKAAAVAARYPHALIIASDTIVALDNQLLGKPAHPAEARDMLTRLRGRDHHVYSAITLLHLQTEKTYTTLSTTMVTMRSYTDAEIEVYLASGDPMDKAGAYAIQNRHFAPVAGLEGCYAGVMGFPLGCLVKALVKFGITLDKVGQSCAKHTGQPCCLLAGKNLDNHPSPMYNHPN